MSFGRACIAIILVLVHAALGCARPLPDDATNSDGSTTSASMETSAGATTEATTGTIPTTTDVATSTSGADDTGTEPACGDGAIDEGEACDGEMLPPEADCVTRGFGEGVPACSADCTTSTTRCAQGTRRVATRRWDPVRSATA